ncbi:hypothetical protein [Streptomyces sp. H27-C3]|uniref:hypothetical protein n=1 Tax=Streptomyces sp. H27-C3 TaxID=3046305 RepID=UPI0024B9AAC6|nr:hypothetical protein [Streptomyces sp. H27-C3]MDJ0464286.1 hypothetical protein [Streptomyces sp. H27-C3]
MTAVMPWERAGSKVSDRHLQRLAAVYIRQSTRQQLLDHQESTRLQYALVDRAVRLGWEADRILVIDEDLGMSGSSAVARTARDPMTPRPRRDRAAAQAAQICAVIEQHEASRPEATHMEGGRVA